MLISSGPVNTATMKKPFASKYCWVANCCQFIAAHSLMNVVEKAIAAVERAESLINGRRQKRQATWASHTEQAEEAALEFK
jgi:hypothetical protein